MFWKILGIEPTKDEEIIKAAYRDKLHYVNPEDDEEGFKELRRAYEDALDYVNQKEEDSLHNVEESVTKGKKNAVDLWVDRVDRIYQDVRLRQDEKEWEEILQDTVCDDLDTELEAAEKLLVYFMSHAYMPQTIWKIVDRRFRYMENKEQWKEKFPENYLDYIKWQIESPGFIDYTLFDGKTDDHVDDYIGDIYEIKNLSEQGDLKRVRKLLDGLKRYEITHPFTDVEEARYLMLQAKELEKQQKEEGKESNTDTESDMNDMYTKALHIMEELDFEYSENAYIERIYAECLIACGKIEQARRVYDTLLDKSPDNVSAQIGVANCVFLSGNPETAKEQLEDILEDRVQDTECLSLMDQMNIVLVEEYERKLQEKFDEDTCYKLGWCLYQQKEFEKGIRLLDQIEENEAYDYVNLRCRLYLANEEYDKAYPLAKKWLKQIEESVDDGSKEMKKRKNRLSLAHFSLGVCIWELLYKKASPEEQKKWLEEGSSFIEQAISEENNNLVKFSYMEQLARFYLEAENYQKCIAVCDAIIEKDRGFFPAYVHRQKANFELKNAKEVIDDYFVCQELYPPYAPPYVLAAEVFYSFDQYDDVEQVLETAKNAGIQSDSLELYRIKCMHYKEFSQENVERALQEIEKLKEKVEQAKAEETDLEDLAELYREYAVLFWDKDDFARTLLIIEDYLKEHPESKTMLHLKVDVLARENRAEEALLICRQLVEKEPDNPYGKMKLSNCYERLRRYEEAIATYDEILENRPDYAPAVRRLMYIYSFLSNQERDLEKCKKGIRYASRYIELTEDAEGYVERGNLLIDLYELEEAVKDCEKAIELDGEAYYAYNNLGCALLKLRKLDEAIPPLKQAVALDPEKEALPYLNLAECYALQGDYQLAIETYRMIIKLFPKRVGLLEEIAKLYRKEGLYAEAIETYLGIPKAFSETFEEEKESNAYCGNTVEAYCDVANTYAQWNDVKNAIKYYKKALRLYKKYKGNQSPDQMKLESVVEFYRDNGDYENAEKYIKKLIHMAKKHEKDCMHLYFTYATVLFEMQQTKEAEKYAGYFLKDLLKRKGGEEAMLADRRYRPMYLYDLGIMHLCAGKVEKAKAYFEQIRTCKCCVTCEAMDCFEYFFGMGLVAELEGNIEEAIQLYEKAIALRGDYPCAKHHLDNLKG